MKRKLAKVAAVASSLTLVGAYVGYRAFGSSTRSHEPPAEVREPEVLLPGSKSAEILPVEEKAPERFMGGSKSAKIVEPEDTEKPVFEKPAKKDEKKPGGK